MKDKTPIRPLAGTAEATAPELGRRLARTRARFVPAGRTLHLVDVENLMGGPLAGPQALNAALAGYERTAVVGPGDHVVAAINPALVLDVFERWPHARLLLGWGVDGADSALLASVADVEWIASRYDRLVVGSGDGIFGPAVAAYRQSGLCVEVVSRARSLSMALAVLASRVAILPVGKAELS